MIRTPAGRIFALVLAASLGIAACGGSGGTSSGSGSGAAASGVTPVPSVLGPGVSPGASMIGSGPADCATGSITALGSTAMQPLVEQAARLYITACPDATINVQGGGSGTGLTQVSGGGADIGNSDVDAEDNLDPARAAELVDHKVVKQGWVMVSNKDVLGVTTLTSQQAKDIWTGKTTNWSEVGGPDLPIVLILRPESSGTRATFKRIVLEGEDEATGQALTEDSNGAVTQAVSATPGATSVIGFAYFGANKERLQAVALDGVEPRVEYLADDSYILTGPAHMYTKGEPTGLAKSFLDYMLSDEIQNVLAPSLYYAPVN